MNSTPLNKDALEAAERAYLDSWTDELEYGDADQVAQLVVSAYLAATQPVVTSVFDAVALNKAGWTCGCEPGNYDNCWECQSVCNELEQFLNRLNRPVEG